MSSFFDGKQRLPVALGWLSGLAFLALAVGFGMDVDILDGQAYPPMRLNSLIAFGVALVIAGAFVVYLGKRFFRVKTNWFFLGGAVVLFLGCLVALCAFPSSYPITDKVTYGISWPQKIYYVFYALVSFGALYIVLTYLPSFNDGVKSYDLYFLGVMALGLIEIIYSYVHEFSAYSYFFTHGYFNAMVQGPTVNKNVYGMVLLVSLGASGYLYVRHHHWAFLVGMFFYYTNILCTRCRTVLILATLTIAVFLMWRYFFSVRKHPIRNNILLGLGLLAVGGVVAVFLLKNRYSNGTWLNNFVSGWEEKAENGDITIKARVDYWLLLLKIYPQNPVLFIFGAGEGNFSYFLGALVFKTNNPPYYFAHSGFVESFGRGGLLRFAIELAFEVYLFVLIIRSYRRKEELATASLGAFLIFFGQGLDESTFYLSCSLKSLTAIVMVAFPLLAQERRVKAAAQVEERRKALVADQAGTSHRKALSVETICHEALFIFTPWFMFLVGVVAPQLEKAPLWASEMVFLGGYVLALGIFVFFRIHKHSPLPLTKKSWKLFLTQLGLAAALAGIGFLGVRFGGQVGRFYSLGLLSIMVTAYYSVSFYAPSVFLGDLAEELALGEEWVAYKRLLFEEKAAKKAAEKQKPAKAQ